MKFTLLFLALCSLNVHADWEYSNEINAMTSKNEPLAIIQSDQSLSLNSPYSGKNFASLAVSSRSADGTIAMFMVEKGQIICNKYKGCNISIRFDDNPAIQFTGYKSADYSSTIIGIRSPDKFIKAAKRAKKILVQVVMYKNGAVILEFTPKTPLQWPIK